MIKDRLCWQPFKRKVEEIADKEVRYLTVTIYMGDKKLEKEDYKNYICVSEYVINLVNQVYYSKIDEYRKRQEEQKKNCG